MVSTIFESKHFLTFKSLEGYTSETRPRTVSEMFEEMARSVIALYVEEVRREAALADILEHKDAIVGAVGNAEMTVQERIVEVLKIYRYVRDSKKSYEETLYDRYVEFIGENGCRTEPLVYSEFIIQRSLSDRGSPWTQGQRFNTIERFETVVREGWTVGSQLVLKTNLEGRVYTIHHFTNTCLVVFETDLKTRSNPLSYVSAQV